MICALAVLLLGDDPLPEAERAKLAAALKSTEEVATKLIREDPEDVRHWSSRGDVRFWLGRFEEAAADYAKMEELEPSLGPRHWRLGLAWFYAGEYAKAARQFERYYETDDVDRENGIWQYFSNAALHGPEKARGMMLKYEKRDRASLPDVYRMLEGELTPEQVVERIGDDADGPRAFYAHLYVGLHHAVEKRPEKAKAHLAKAIRSPWPRRAGYGPRYMWHVARLHWDLLAEGAR